MQKNEIVMIHGTDYFNMTLQLLQAADLGSVIGSKTARIALKPNIVFEDKAENGAVTHPEIVDGVLQYLRDNGFENLSVMEGSWVGGNTTKAVEVSGIAAVCRKHDVPFYDLQKDKSHKVDAKGMELNLCDRLKEVDFLINLPVLKGHCQTTVTCALKNAKGLIPNSEKRRFHTMGLHEPIAHLNTVLPREFVLVDNICGDLEFEEGGNPVQMDRIFAVLDPVLCDAYVCECMGHSLDDVRYITLAEKLGVGSTDTANAKITLLNEPLSAGRMQPTGRARTLSQYTDAQDACSACYGMLIHALDRLDKRGETKGKTQLVHIGQAWQGKEGEIGVGRCTAGHKCSLKGCPPKAKDMVEFLLENWK